MTREGLRLRAHRHFVVVLCQPVEIIEDTDAGHGFGRLKELREQLLG